MKNPPPQYVGQFIQECEPLLKETWPFFSPLDPNDKFKPLVLPSILALNIKCHLDLPDDADTIFFWNIAKEAQKQIPLTRLDLAILAAGASIVDHERAQRWAREFGHGNRYHAHMSICAGERINSIQQRFWCQDFEESDNNFVRWLMSQAYNRTPQRCETIAICINVWQNRILNEYPNRMGGCFEEGFGAEHPFTKWTQGVA